MSFLLTPVVALKSSIGNANILQIEGMFANRK